MTSAQIGLARRARAARGGAGLALQAVWAGPESALVIRGVGAGSGDNLVVAGACDSLHCTTRLTATFIEGIFHY
ncbi:hypothetical protein ACOMHN_066600 [Nucella lapillus]